MRDNQPNQPILNGNSARRQVADSAAAASLMAVVSSQSVLARDVQEPRVATIITNARATTLDPVNPEGQAIAISGGLSVRDLKSLWGAIGRSCFAA